MNHVLSKKSSQQDYLLRRSKNKVKSGRKWVSYKKLKKIFTLLIPAIFIFLQLSVTVPQVRYLQVKYLRNLNCTDSSNIACTILRWKGDSLVELPKEDKIEATVVLTYCGEDMSAFNRYLDEKSEHIHIRDVTIISGCSEPFPTNFFHYSAITSQWKEPELNFIEWLAIHAESAKSKSLPEYFNNENHVIIFLNPKLLESIERRSMDEVVQHTRENGFGCVLRPHDRNSYYHDSNALRLFTSEELATNQTRNYNDFGEWIDKLNLSSKFDGLVPVCYSSSFAIKSRDLSQSPEEFYDVLEAMQNAYKANQYSELVEFMERSMAGIFSYPLSEEEVSKLKKYSTQVISGTAYSGALYHTWTMHSWYRLFLGDTLEKQDLDLSQLRLTLVVSYCNENMSWMNAYFAGLGIQNVTIISKCIEPIIGFNPPQAVIERLPNVGRCDHAYATWMANMTKEDATENHIVIFMKGSRVLYQPGHRYRPIQDVIRIANERGFGCEAAPFDKSAFYRTDELRRFLIANHKAENIKSPHENLGAWADALGIELPSPLTPVCYGGNFAVKATQIYAKKDLMSKMAESLSRGDNIEEGHFAERAWAGILSNPLNSNETAVMSSIPTRNGVWGPFAGQIHINE